MSSTHFVIFILLLGIEGNRIFTIRIPTINRRVVAIRTNCLHTDHDRACARLAHVIIEPCRVTLFLG